jgi:glycine cleavage system H lipoate-binding protein
MKMKCPFLEEIMVAYCKGCSVKKMLPKDQLVLQNPCETDYSRCPIYQDFFAEKKKEPKMVQEVHKDEGVEKEKPCIWMKAGVVAYRMCVTNYDCKNCSFDQALVDGEATESPLVAQAIAKLRQLPASERKCRYMLTGDFSYKICPNNYECWHCVVDQYVQDAISSHPFLHKRKERAAKQGKAIRGFTIRKDFNYLPNHIWIKVDGETATVGIDDFAARIIGDIESVDMPDKANITTGEQCWEFGKNNRIARMSLPIDAQIVERNHAIESDPDLVKRDPYNKGWLLKIKTPDKSINMLKGDEALAWFEKEIENLFHEVESNANVMIPDGGEVPKDLAGHLNDDQWNAVVKRFLH